jgi:hypothetical protein
VAEARDLAEGEPELGTEPILLSGVFSLASFAVERDARLPAADRAARAIRYREEMLGVLFKGLRRRPARLDATRDGSTPAQEVGPLFQPRLIGY